MNRTTSIFLKHFPGPYSIRVSTDGVDKTFEVFCLTSDETVIASRYWLERDEAYLVAAVIEASLNSVLADVPTRLTDQDFKTFRNRYPGSYMAVKTRCICFGGDLKLWGIRCRTTGFDLITVDDQRQLADLEEFYQTQVEEMPANVVDLI